MSEIPHELRPTATSAQWSWALHRVEITGRRPTDDRDRHCTPETPVAEIDLTERQPRARRELELNQLDAAVERQRIDTPSN